VSPWQAPDPIDTASEEALTNVSRHAGVKDVTVRAWTTAGVLTVQIEDRGRGFDPEVAAATLGLSGLTGMQERVKELNGHLTVDASQTRLGTQITAKLPLHRPRRTEDSNDFDYPGRRPSGRAWVEGGSGI
jgi:signal transduction histidine kinase